MPFTSDIPKPRNLQVACFIQGMQTPSSRFRVLEYRSALQKLGIELTLFPPTMPKGGASIKGLRGPFYWAFKRLTQLFGYFPSRAFQILNEDLGRFDAVLIQKSMMDWPSSSFLERMAAKKNPRILFDIDDAEFTRVDDFGRSGASVARAVAQISQVVIAGNGYLADHFADSPARVEILSTTVDEARFFPTNSQPNHDSVCIGWTGTPANFRYLFDLTPIFEQLSRLPGVNFRIISDRTHIPDLAHIPGMEFVKWNAAEEVAQLQAFDIGLMPLRDNPWTRGKCAFKLVQYQAIGIPSVVSPVGANLEVQQEGETGYFAHTPEEWFTRLTRLVEDRELRARMGGLARARYLEKLSLGQNARRLAELLRVVAESRA